MDSQLVFAPNCVLDFYRSFQPPWHWVCFPLQGKQDLPHRTIVMMRYGGRTCETGFGKVKSALTCSKSQYYSKN